MNKAKHLFNWSTARTDPMLYLDALTFCSFHITEGIWCWMQKNNKNNQLRLDAEFRPVVPPGHKATV